MGHAAAIVGKVQPSERERQENGGGVDVGVRLDDGGIEPDCVDDGVEGNDGTGEFEKKEDDDPEWEARLDGVGTASLGSPVEHS
jgi:hypothetical protein